MLDMTSLASSLPPLALWLQQLDHVRTRQTPRSAFHVGDRKKKGQSCRRCLELVRPRKGCPGVFSRFFAISRTLCATPLSEDRKIRAASLFVALEQGPTASSLQTQSGEIEMSFLRAGMLSKRF